MISRGWRYGSVSKHFWPGQHEDLSLTPWNPCRNTRWGVMYSSAGRQRQEDSWGPRVSQSSQICEIWDSECLKGGRQRSCGWQSQRAVLWSLQTSTPTPTYVYLHSHEHIPTGIKYIFLQKETKPRSVRWFSRWGCSLPNLETLSWIPRTHMAEKNQLL